MSQNEGPSEELRKHREQTRELLKLMAETPQAQLCQSDHGFKAEMAEAILFQLKSLRAGKHYLDAHDGAIDFPENAEIHPGIYKSEFTTSDGNFVAQKIKVMNQNSLEIHPSLSDGQEETSIENQYFDTFQVQSKFFPKKTASRIYIDMVCSAPLVDVVNDLDTVFIRAGLKVNTPWIPPHPTPGNVIRGGFKTYGGKTIIIDKTKDPKEYRKKGYKVVQPSEGEEAGLTFKLRSLDDMLKEAKSARDPDKPTPLMATDFSFHIDDLDRAISAFKKFAEQERRAAQYPDISPPGGDSSRSPD
jgi:hypothetical protein